MTDHRNEQIHTFFSWAWCTLLAVIVIWGIIALAQLHRSGITSPEQGQHTAAVALGLIITAGVCLATGLRKRYPGWLGPLQLAGSWLVFPVFRLIHEVWPRSFDEQLLHLDRLLWAGKSLPQWAMRLEQYWLSEILSFCYFSFYLIIIGSTIYFAPRHKPYGHSFFHGIMLMYLFGFLGYIMIPAAGPYAAFPSDFPYPPEGQGNRTYLA